mmetsp:Transcript_41068/g.87490  ORF Transcript_41068/g.87490 Transcript_41068/m.87490 type:complete len:351 (+) Transcript_41068:306-1358(+)|eukprot:CAMPEP_0172574310 /NCGR_PEP_ID=MMETSP1067-20121228/136634_1 /TAXON_ID=265564 ORGANISM="Thalassiosira punctigera, Strain Tpunct2005C2" /NCGR_SAMPLE_ID=MMETSP1067 /ASSEMBLY_ACC=CAM_ASM_000444 /LENGTH=350 /DNA_ID=CAMNT_0013366933 /DNA_START=1136 /DNA_END=2188 /DNA_ORIENTATION=-
MTAFVAVADPPHDSLVEHKVEDAFQQLMNRGSYLRQLRLLALEDERERQAHCAYNNEEKKEEHDETMMSSNASCTDVASLHVEQMHDKISVLPKTGENVLDYNSYLAHQRYFDDLKHIDIKYMDYGNVPNAGGDDMGRLVVEQRKGLGKGGLCWDAAFVLGEHVTANEAEWNADGDATAPSRVVELGAGTGLTGLMIAKATRSDVVVTDLPELEGLMRDNVRRNFGGSDDEAICESAVDHDHRAKGTISSRVLRWGVKEDYGDAPYDVIIGADIVTSLYDPRALAETVHALSGPNTRIYISGKARLDKPHEEFDAEMRRLFERVEKVRRPMSRLRCPDVFVIAAGGKKQI